MQEFEYTSFIDAAASELFAWHERPGAFERLAPPWMPMRLESSEGIRDGQETVLRLGWGPLAVRWVARHQDYHEGAAFTDVQVSGPFEAWTHVHEFEDHDSGRCKVTDRIFYEPPFGAAGEWMAGGHIENTLREQFAYRHRILRHDSGLHGRYPQGSLTIAITGASGLIGSTLAAFLKTGGHRVIRLVRRPSTSKNDVLWNTTSGVREKEKLEGVDAVVHLAGENLFAPRWTEAKKRRIYDSRVQGTKLLARDLAGLSRKPRVFISSSAIGIYGDRGDEELTEDSDVDHDAFLARLCLDWEAAADEARQAGIRTVHPRTGLVISGAGGALGPMLPLFKAGLGGRLGIPEAYLSWIAMDDVVGAIYHAIYTDDITGPMNLTAPAPVTWNEFAPALGRVLNRPTFVTVPAWLIRAASGEVAENVILPSARVFPGVLEQTGYEFLFPDLEASFRHQLGRTNV